MLNVLNILHLSLYMLPSKKFCETGILDYENGERYHQLYHNYGTTAHERCPSRYDAHGREIVHVITDKNPEEPTSLQKTSKN
jgi:hypothetical protein